MSKINLKYFFVILIFACLSIVLNAAAQEGVKDPNAATQKQAAESVLPKLDQRLPPVLPGEEVKVGNKKMKVWSTSGTLTTEGQVPQPGNASGDWTVNNPNDISVVVDGRGLIPNRGPRR